MMGSSPLARGIFLSYLTSGNLSGIIPARAGNMCFADFYSAYLRDHPRSRGEYLTPFKAKFMGLGSSPLARGISFPDSSPLPGPGIIPARAGNMHILWNRLCRGRDHPRSRGEYPNAAITGVANPGSSPLARGIW